MAAKKIQMPKPVPCKNTMSIYSQFVKNALVKAHGLSEEHKLYLFEVLAKHAKHFEAGKLQKKDGNVRTFSLATNNAPEIAQAIAQAAKETDDFKNHNITFIKTKISGNASKATHFIQITCKGCGALLK